MPAPATGKLVPAWVAATHDDIRLDNEETLAMETIDAARLEESRHWLPGATLVAQGEGDAPGATDENEVDLDPVGAVASGSWRFIHTRLLRLATQKSAYDAEEARWLVAGKLARVHERCGFASYSEYMERILGYTPRAARERLRVAEALQVLPETRQALADGVLCWSVVRELSRVATPETEPAWIGAARGQTVRQVEELVAGRAVGDRPEDPPRPQERRYTLTFEVDAATYARHREAEQLMKQRAGRRLSHSELIAGMSEAVLARTYGSADSAEVVDERSAGRAAHQVAITICGSCRRTWQDGGGKAVEVDGVTREMAECDGQYIGPIRRVEDATHGGDDAADTGVTHGGRAERRAYAERATQTVAPRIRRLVVRRAHGTCEVPGCRNAAFTHIHHIRFRCTGPDHSPENLTLICSSHHRQVHVGRLRIEGRAPDLRFLHADGRPYGEVTPLPVAPAAPSAVDTRARAGEADRDEQLGEVISALRHMGFTAPQARNAAGAARAELPADASLERHLRSALQRATRSRR